MFERGYDFGYLLKILTCAPLPPNENDFFQLLALWFPCIYDIKHVVRSVKTLRGGLQEIAESLGVSTFGIHQYHYEEAVGKGIEQGERSTGMHCDLVFGV
jgi:hypothetical protein